MIQLFSDGKVKKDAVTFASLGAIIFIVATISRIVVDRLMVKKLKLDIAELEARKPTTTTDEG